MNDSSEAATSPAQGLADKPAVPPTPAAGEAAKAESPRTLFFTVFPSIMLPMFLAVADQTIVATALPAIASNLGEIERASWVVVSYLIANTIAAPVYGRLCTAGTFSGVCVYWFWAYPRQPPRNSVSSGG